MPTFSFGQRRRERRFGHGRETASEGSYEAKRQIAREQQVLVVRFAWTQARGSFVRRHDLLGGPRARAASGEDLLGFRAAVPFDVFDDRPVYHEGKGIAVFRCLY